MLHSVGLSYVYVWVLGRTSEADKLHPTLLLLVTPFRGVRSGSNTFLKYEKISYCNNFVNVMHFDFLAKFNKEVQFS